MALILPQYVVLDSATLSKVSFDYWSADSSRRAKARKLLDDFSGQSIYIGVTFTHVMELLRYEDERVVRDRIRFLSKLPLLAWLRPFDGSWFPGGIADILTRELQATVHGGAREWSEIIEQVRPQIWETGTGSEMFVDDDYLWSTLREEAKRQHSNEKYVASVARTNPGEIQDLRFDESQKLVRRTKQERATYMRQFASNLSEQLKTHGDKRLEAPTEIAREFANKTLRDVAAMEAAGGDPVDRLLEFMDVPLELINPEMTVGEIGAIAVYVKQLQILSKRLVPPTDLSIKDVPPDKLPSYVIEKKLNSIQRKATRISGSDLGDGHISPLILYANGVEVDKRTFEYLTQVKRDGPTLAAQMNRFFRSSDYSELPDCLASG